MTLMELLSVLVILIAVGMILVPLFGTVAETAEYETTYATMSNLRNAIVGTPSQPGYFQDMKHLPISSSTDVDVAAGAGMPQQTSPLPAQHAAFSGVMLHGTVDLFVQPTGSQAFLPATAKGWRGPYMSLTAGYLPSPPPGSLTPQIGEVFDSFPGGGQPGRPILIVWPPVGTPGRSQGQGVFLVSTGPDGLADLDYTTNYDPATLSTNSALHDDLILFLQVDPNSTLPQTGPWTNYYTQLAKLRK
jgi:hypothetical protein